jgi:hypothetical protein
MSTLRNEDELLSLVRNEAQKQLRLARMPKKGEKRAKCDVQQKLFLCMKGCMRRRIEMRDPYT